MKTAAFGGMGADELVEKALGAIPEYMRWKYSAAPFNVDFCVRKEKDVIRRLYASRDGRDPERPLSPVEQQELDGILGSLNDTLVRRTLAFKEEEDRKKTVRSINGTSASMRIHAKLEEYGLHGSVKTSGSGADVEILIKGSTWMHLKFTYQSLLRKGFLDGKMQAARDLRETVIRLGLRTRIKRR